ncbi:MAG: glutamate racemase [Parachlamydiaceae bacterium]|nr:glutamate racemase [Parachlamydiaceae bacterium]
MKYPEKSPYSIGMFDSGLGGLTVLRQLLKVLPHEQFIYYGDTARLPYGDKSRETIIGYSLDNADFLLTQQIKLLVVACSTASSFALEQLQQHLDIPVIGMIEPGADIALRATKTGRIAILGTKGTIKSEAYKMAILARNPDVMVTSLACPLFVPLVEEHFLVHPATPLIVQEYLKPLKAQQIDTILLGCTHYPLLKDLICAEMGEDVMVIDPAMACAEKVLSTLDQHGLQMPEKYDIRTSEHRFFVSDDPDKFQMLGEIFLGRRISFVESRNLISCELR